MFCRLVVVILTSVSLADVSQRNAEDRLSQLVIRSIPIENLSWQIVLLDSQFPNPSIGTPNELQQRGLFKIRVTRMWLFQKLATHFTKNKENLEEKPVAIAEPERKRKRDADELDEKYARKRQRIEDKTQEIYTVQDRFEENSDLSENDEYFEVDNIAEFLSPRDKELLRQDPFNQNFAATTWTNEFTLLKDNSEFNKWRNCANSHSGVFPREIFTHITTYCAPVTLFTLRRVSKSLNALVVQSDNLWRTHFYSRRWKLRQDLENGFCGVEPLDEDKSEWVNVIPDNEVDWFGEYRRNHVNSYFIRTLIGEITTKLQRIVDEYGVVKSKVKEAGEQPLLFSPGLTDEEIDEQNKPDLPITNDMRELLRCCSGQRFKLKDTSGYDLYGLPPHISIGSYCDKGITYARAEIGGYADEPEDPLCHDPYPPCDALKAPYHGPKTQLEPLDVDSDGDDYEPSQSSYDSEDEHRMTVEELNENSKIAEDGVFGHHRHMPMIEEGSIYDTDSDEEQYYDTNTASFIINNTSYGWSECVTCPSIVDYLQDVSDCLDSPLIPFWLKLDDYALVKWDQADDEFVDTVEAAEFGLGLNHWADLVQEAGQHYKTDLYYVPRAVKLLAAAAQDTIVKVFQRAQELETSDELQLNTFQRAAKEVSTDTYVLEPPARSWRRH